MEWISVKNKLPELEPKKGRNVKMVHVKFKDGTKGKILYGNSGMMGEGNGWFNYKLPNVTHWAEIEPPKTIEQ